MTERVLGAGRNIIVAICNVCGILFGSDRAFGGQKASNSPLLGPTKSSQVGVNVKSALVGSSTFTELCIVNLFHKNKL